jgi:hypothetical protein
VLDGLLTNTNEEEIHGPNGKPLKKILETKCPPDAVSLANDAIGLRWLKPVGRGNRHRIAGKNGIGII